MIGIAPVLVAGQPLEHAAGYVGRGRITAGECGPETPTVPIGEHLQDSAGNLISTPDSAGD